MVGLLPVFCLAFASRAGGFISPALVSRSTPAAAAFAVPLTAPPLEAVLPQLDAAQRLREAAVTWAGSLAKTTMPADDLMLALVSPEAYKMLRDWKRQSFGHQEALRRVLEGARRQIRVMGCEIGSPLRGATVAVRSKGLWSTFHKAHVRRKAVQDVLAVRVVLREDADVYEALDAIRAVWPAVPGRFKDYVALPKANGYQGLHDTLRLPCGHSFEIQLRSKAMHREAEWGRAAHRKYKGAVSQTAARVITGIADGRARWPLQPQTALSLASRLVAEVE